MKNTTNKNLIYAVATFVFVLVFSVASPVSARTVTVDTGARFTAENVENTVATNTTDTTKNTTNKTNGVVKKSTSDTDVNGDSLSANAIFGASGFMQSSIMWAFLTLLIILAVITWRKATKTKEEEHAPLKHA